MNEMNPRRSLVLLVTSLCIMGTIGLFRRYIPLSSGLLAFWRGLIGAVSLLVFILLRRRGAWQRIGGRKLAALAATGACLGINWMLFFEACSRTTIARATLCYYMQPTIVLLLSAVLFRERLTARKLVCAVVALAGMVLVSGVLEPAADGPDGLNGVLYGLGAACFYAMVVILNKKIGGVDIYRKTTIELFAAALTLTPWLLATGGFSGVTYDAGLILPLLVAGVFYTGITYAMYFGSMGGLKAQTISALSYIDPVMAMLVSALILGEGLTPAGIIGAVLILGAAIAGERPDADLTSSRTA